MSITTEAGRQQSVTRSVAARYRQLASLYHRARPYLDLAMSRRQVRFRELRRQFYEDMWRVAARNVGADHMPWRFGYDRLRRDGVSTVVNLSRVMLDDPVTLSVMGNKILTYELLREYGYRIPRYVACSRARFADAQEFLARSQGPVVVKPAMGTGGGRGVTTGITSAGALRRASLRALRFCEHLIVEEQVPGSSYRLLYLDGRFIDAIRRDPPALVGDGRGTLRKLVQLENRRRLTERPFTSMNPLALDDDCRNWLRSQGLTPASRPAAGDRVVVKRAVNENCARENHNVRETVHPEIVEAGAGLVAALGVSFAGLDLMCTDIGVPLSQSGGCFNEVNTTPGIHHHYLIAEPSGGVPVAEILLEHLFAIRRGVAAL